MSTDISSDTVDESFKKYVREELAANDRRIEELEEALAEKDEHIEVLEERVDELESRTDMLRLVEDSDDLDGEQRSAALLQHLQKKATSSSGRDKAAITRERCEEVLHYPDIHRTTFISDMQRVVREVGDEDVCWYEGRDSGPAEKARLILNLERTQPGETVSTALNGGA